MHKGLGDKDNLAKYILNLMLILWVFVMAVQVTEFNFMDRSSLIGPVIIIIIISAFYLFFNRQMFLTKYSVLIISSATIFFVYYIVNINNQIERLPEYMIFLAIIYLLFIFISVFKQTFFIFPMWAICVALVSTLFIPGLFSDNTMNNLHASTAFVLLFFCVITMKESHFFIKFINIYSMLILIAVIYSSNSRNTIIALISVLLVFCLYSKIKKYIFPIIVSTIVLNITFTLTYVLMKNTKLGIFLNDITKKYTNKNLYSGRGRIWGDSFNEVVNSNAALTGLGNNFQFETNNGYIHNLYAQIFYQSGLIGVLLFISLIVLIGLLAKKVKIQTNDYYFRTLFAFFIGVLMLQLFERFLITSYLKISLTTVLCWVIIGLFVNKLLFMQDVNKKYNI
ncbi:O-antigen ligase family protein [Virgibacillus litoralis]|uniref:O-antigen ligase-related domain-containing protein n=1 Tax=Virgibacillus litoralis TaxID=578221 RepID=A0ABS4HI84_9BACI|nr:O-antigen ligase family protein [Virgibacillus litoralis]MBP1950573.1 hypothetical protein [Virgibacillus litoralis]